MSQIKEIEDLSYQLFMEKKIIEGSLINDFMDFIFQ